MAKILIPTPLRPYTDKQDAVDASGATVGELLADLTRRHSGLKAHLFNDQGKLRSFVNVYVNDEDIRYLQKEQTPVTAGDTVSIIPSVAGGVDTVEFSNLQRQILHGTPDVGRSKLASAKDKLHALNPEIDIQTYEVALSSQNAMQLFEPYDVVVDGTDNFPTRYLVNDACVLLGKPNAYGR